MRTFLDGRFENSAFCILSPNGQDWLTRANRGPEMVLGRGSATREMSLISLRYPAKANLEEAIVQDFHSFRQALNVASADQRVLVLVHATAEREKDLRQSLRHVANDPSVVGRFHFDFDQDAAWKEKIEGTRDGNGIVLINPGEFGMSGKVMNQLPLDATKSEIISALKAANTEFARTTTKKVYADHVAKGRSAGVYFEGAVPYGEDRDGDGQIDRGGRGRRPSAGQGRGQRRGPPGQ